MKVLKFGGTSVGSVERIKSVAKLIHDGKQKVIVLSAMSGTTNALVSICNALETKQLNNALTQINTLKEKYDNVINDLYKQEEFSGKATKIVQTIFENITKIAQKETFTPIDEKIILAQGELISTNLVNLYLNENGIKSSLLASLNFMKIDANDEPLVDYIKDHIQDELKKSPNSELFIAQGYICRNINSEIDNLKRGGSDYTATLIGAAINAEEVQIWTDIDGMHNNDPRYVENTKPLAQLSFDEAAELAYFGAKILHPSTILPAKQYNIPVRLKNTMNPKAPGTLIKKEVSDQKKIKAIAAKDNITVIKIKSGRMLLAYGFLRKVFEIFELYKTPIDMITTSEIAVSLTIDNTKNIEKIQQELKQYGTVEIENNQVIICVVGDFISDSKGQALKVFEALKNIPIRMISYGGSSHNISILIEAQYKKQALVALSETLFNN